MLLLGLDFETTGLSPETDRIIEVGAVLWDTETRKPMALFSELVQDETYPPLSAEITDITGICGSDLETLGAAPVDVFARLYDLVVIADAIVAHNGTRFDRLFYDVEIKRQGLAAELWLKHWIDTSVDVPYPAKVQTRKLVHLAAEHGFVNPFAHRALFDSLTMLKVLDTYDIEVVYALSLEPSVTLVANVKPPWTDGGASTNLAKARGYRWDGANKTWTKVVKQSQVETEMRNVEFPVSVERKAG